MRTSANGIRIIKNYEGFRAKPYVCPAGKLTVGYGHVVRPGEDFSAGLTEQEAHELLLKDLAPRENAVSKLVKVPVSQNQADALISFVYNLGSNALAQSTLLRMLNQRNYSRAQQEFHKWVWATVDGKKQKLNGLVKRRKEEAELFGRKDMPGNDQAKQAEQQAQAALQKDIDTRKEDKRNAAKIADE